MIQCVRDERCLDAQELVERGDVGEGGAEELLLGVGEEGCCGWRGGERGVVVCGGCDGEARGGLSLCLRHLLEVEPLEPGEEPGDAEAVPRQAGDGVSLEGEEAELGEGGEVEELVEVGDVVVREVERDEVRQLLAAQGGDLGVDAGDLVVAQQDDLEVAEGGVRLQRGGADGQAVEVRDVVARQVDHLDGLGDQLDVLNAADVVGAEVNLSQINGIQKLRGRTDQF